MCFWRQELRDYLCAIENYYLQINYYDINYHHALTLLCYCKNKLIEKENFIFSHWEQYKSQTYIRFYREIRVWLLIILLMSGYMDIIMERMDFERLIERFLSLKYKIEKESSLNAYNQITF